MTFKERLGERIAKAREAAGLTKTEAAQRAGMPYKRWFRYESGEQEPGAEKLLHIAGALDVSIDSLLKGL